MKISVERGLLEELQACLDLENYDRASEILDEILTKDVKPDE